MKKMMMMKKWTPRWSSSVIGLTQRRLNHQDSMSCRQVVKDPRLGSKDQSWMAPIAGCKSPEGQRAWKVVRIEQLGVRIEVQVLLLGSSSSLAYLRTKNVLLLVKFYVKVLR